MLEKIEELTEGVKFLGSKYEELKTNMKKAIDNQELLNKSLVKALKENKEQKKEISVLKDRVEYLERCNLENTFNIYPVFKTGSQDVKGIVYKIGGKINVNLDESNIVSAYRRPDKKNGKPGEIVVKCLNKGLRDQIVDAAKKKGLTHKDIGIKCNIDRIYINEELTNSGKDIYYRALKLKYELKWKYIWVKYGKIYAKKNDGDQAVRLDTMEILDKLLK